MKGQNRRSRVGGTPKVGVPFDVIPSLPGGAFTYFHAPSTVVTANGDLLVTAALGPRHGIGVIVQSRSKDGGITWRNSDRAWFEGVVYDHGVTTKGGSAYNPAYGLAPDGGLVLAVQTTDIAALEKGGEPVGFTGYVYLKSLDHGVNYRYKGFVDSKQPENVGAVTTNILTWRGTMYLISSSYVAGCRLYTSADNGETWQLRSQIFPLGLSAPSLWYPTLTFLSGGSLYVLALARMPDGEERNYTRISVDEGRTWGPVELAQGLSVRHPVLNWIGDTLVVHGRHTPTHDVIVHYSFNQGKTWSARRIIEDYETDGGYSSSARVGNRLFVAFSSDARKRRVCLIRGVFLD